MGVKFVTNVQCNCTILISTGVEKLNDVAKRSYHSSNKWDPTETIGKEYLFPQRCAERGEHIQRKTQNIGIVVLLAADRNGKSIHRHQRNKYTEFVTQQLIAFTHVSTHTCTCIHFLIYTLHHSSTCMWQKLQYTSWLSKCADATNAMQWTFFHKRGR